MLRMIIVILVNYLSYWLKFLFLLVSAGFGERSLAVDGAVAGASAPPIPGSVVSALAVLPSAR